MIRRRNQRCGRALTAAMSGLALLTALVASGPAEAWWRGGFFIGVPGPVVVGPPVVYAPPPVYYAPPPVYYGPPPTYPPPPYPAPQAHATVPGRTCYAGSYICTLAEGYPPGAACSCETGRGPAYGRVR